MDPIIIVVIISIIIIVILCVLLYKSRSKSLPETATPDVSELENQISKKDQLIAISNQKTDELNKGLSERNEKIQKLETRIFELEESLKAVKDEAKAEVVMASNTSSEDTKVVAKITENAEESNKLQAEIEKLKKQLNDTEDELEDAQDDAEDYKKRWEDQRNKLNEASERLNKCDKELKELKEAFEQKITELENTQSTLTKKQESIDFLNEILRAKDADNKDVKELNDKLSKLVGIVEGDVITCLKNAGSLQNTEEASIKNQLWQWMNLQKKTWLQKNKVIAFVGEFSAGKTSIVNRILSQDDDNAPKLPVSSKATTAIATYISHGRDFHCSFTNPEGKLKNISSETFEKVNKEVLEEVNVSPLIQYFVMSYNNQNLQNLSVLDTPGFNSNDNEDAKRTADVIKEADALFWVFDANTGEINKSSLSIIKDNLQNLPLFIVLNKADTKSPGELDKLEAHIKETIKNNNISVNGYIRFSHKAPINVLFDAINSVKHDDSKNEFINELFNKLINVKNGVDENYKIVKKELETNTKKEERCLQTLFDKGGDIYDTCEDVKEMPELKKHWWGSEHYDMSPEQFMALNDRLDEVIGKANEMNELNETLVGLSKNTKSSQDKFDNVKIQRNEIEKCIIKFKDQLHQINSSLIDSLTSYSSSNRSDSNSESNNDYSQNSSYKVGDNTSKSDSKSDMFIISANNRLNKYEEKYLNEIINIYQDNGGFSDNDIPMLQKLGKGYRISPDRSLEIANYIINYFSSKQNSNVDSENFNEDTSVNNSDNSTDINNTNTDISSIITNNRLNTNESKYLYEILSIYNDRGGFSDDDVPMLNKLAEGYRISPDRSIEIANFIINYYNSNSNANDNSNKNSNNHSPSRQRKSYVIKEIIKLNLISEHESRLLYRLHDLYFQYNGFHDSDLALRIKIASDLNINAQRTVYLSSLITNYYKTH